MSASTSIHPDEKYKADKVGNRMFKIFAAVGVVLLAISLVLGAAKGDTFRRFFHAYMIGWSFVFSIAIGALFFILVHHISRAKYGIVLRRLAEFMVAQFPLLFVLGLGLIIPVLAGYKHLYFWTEPQLHNESHPLWHHMHHKLGWLSPAFFAARYVFYFAVFIGIARYFVKTSKAMDTAPDAETAARMADRMRVVSGPSIVAYALTLMFAVTDFFMTMQPTWYSTIYSVNYFAGGMLAAYCTMALLARALQRQGKLVHSVTVEHYHDVGKYMFGWTFFWIYTAFSQFMLQWYGNMPEETLFYNYRMFSPQWMWVTVALLIGHWAFPYVALVTRWSKRILPLLMFLAVWQLAFHWLDLYWNIMPNAQWTVANGVQWGPLAGDPALHKIGFNLVDVTLWLTMVALFLAGVGKAMKGNLMPVKDPKLGECLAFENY
jgi:hypothetical protein